MQTQNTAVDATADWKKVSQGAFEKGPYTIAFTMRINNTPRWELRYCGKVIGAYLSMISAMAQV